ncbi:amino acid adenylation domain-containing protein [Saccharopolyspora sp. NPDC003752]
MDPHVTPQDDLPSPAVGIHALIARQMAATPDAPALIWEEGTLSYGQLSAWVDLMATHVQAAGGGQDIPVGLMAWRSPELVIGLLGILTAGSAYVPLDPEYPEKRLRFLATSCRLPITVAMSGAPAGSLRADGVQVVQIPQPIGQPPRCRPVTTRFHPDQLAYVLHTSGSTGVPKGVATPHRGVVNRLLWMQERFAIGPGDRVLQKTPFTFDVSAWELLWPLITGAALVLATPGAQRDPIQLTEIIQRHGITVVHFVPPMLDAFLAAPDAAACVSLRDVICSGQELTADLRDRFYLGPGRNGAMLHNLYGPTEASIDVTAWTCLPGERKAQIPIGYPITNTALSIVDADLRPVADGEPGELLLGGHGLARGYVGQAALTAAAFVPGEDGQRLYRTGDRVVRLPGGPVVYLGRLDDQVKVRGFRVEPAEIEHHLLRLPGVRQCAVVAVGNGADARLIGYVTGGIASEREMIGDLADHLPAHMVPSRVIRLTALPVGRHGKTDREALRRRIDADQPSDTGLQPPVGEQEEWLAALWSQVLGVQSVGRDDSFFHLGGTSLLAAKVITRVQERFRVRITMREFTATPTVSSLASLLTTASARQAMPALTGLTGTSQPETYTPTSAQHALWALRSVNPAAASAYTVPSALRITGLLDVDALQGSLHEVIREHAAFRTGFRTDETGLVAYVLRPDDPRCAIALPVHDLTSFGEDAYVEAERRASWDAGRPFAAEAAPLLRATLWRLRPTEHLLLVVVDHLVFDGWSQDILDHELSVHYGRLTGHAATGAGVSGPHVARSEFHDYAQWLQRCESAGVIERQVRAANEALVGIGTPLRRFGDLPEPRSQEFRGRRHTIVVPQGTDHHLRRLAAEESATPFAVHLAAFVLALDAYSDGDLLLGTVMAGRLASAVEHTVGYFANTVPLRLSTAGSATFRSLVGHARDVTATATDRQQAPLAQIDTGGGKHPHIRAVLVSQGEVRTRAAFPGLGCTAVAIDNGSAKFPVTLLVEEHRGRTHVILETRTDQFTEPAAQQLLDSYVRILAAATADPDTAPAALVTTRPKALPQTAECIHHRFERAAAKYPGNIAVIHNDHKITYRDLDAAGNCVAHRLIERGVRPGMTVGICAERGLAFIIGLLGVLKAGAAYAPLDPRYPKARNRLVLQDTDCPVIIGTTAQLAALGKHTGQFLLIDEECADDHRHQHSPPATVTVTPEYPAYVIHSSGTTGRPKGVPVSHRSVTQLFDAAQRQFRFGQRDVWTGFHSFAFDFSVWEIWGALLHGGSLIVVDHAISRDPEAFWSLLIRHHVTVLSQTPSAFRQLLPAAQRAGFPDTALRLVVFGGEELSPAMLQPWFDRYGDTRPQLVNMYGITETTVHVTLRPLERADVVGARSPIGRPLPGAAVHLLDDDLRPVAQGTIGEVFVGGSGVAAGYLQMAGMTAQRFLPDPFGPPGSRLYRTGDLAEYDTDGELCFRGRVDDQVQLRGHRIEPGEVEAALLSDGRIEHAVVVLRDDPQGEPRLVGYVVPRPGVALVPRQLRERLSHVLPSHMVPSTVILIDSLPMTQQGKLDRTALPDPVWPLVGRIAEPATVSTAHERERTLKAIWEAVLGETGIGIDDDFFALGGDSILAIRLIAMARTAGLAMDVATVFARPTIRDLAALPTRGEPVQRLPTAHGAPGWNERCYPMTAQQLGIAYECEVERDPTLYHDLLAVHLRGRLDTEGLRDALQQISQAHEALRTSFHLDAPGGPIQRVHDDLRIPLMVEPPSAVVEPARRVERWWLRQRHNAFDLASAPLIRCHILPHSATAYDLCLTTHHVLLDGWSLATVAADLLHCYRRQLSGEAPNTRSLPTAGQRSCVVRERAAREDEAEQEFWRRYLDGIDPGPCPGGGVVRSPEATARIQPDARILLPTTLTPALRQVARDLSVSLKSVHVAAHLWAVGELAGQSDVSLGVVCHTRPEEGNGDREVGMFLNSLPFRANLASMQNWAQLIRCAAVRERELMPHRWTPLADLVAINRGPVFHALFNYTDFHLLDNVPSHGELQVCGWYSNDRTSFPLFAESNRLIGSSQVELTVRAHHLGASTAARRYAALALRAVEAIAEDPLAPLPDHRLSE